MKKYVQLYLSRYYEIETSPLGNDGVYEKLDVREFRTPIYGEILVKRLNLIFSLSDELLAEIVNEWAKEIRPDVDLEFYWSDLLLWFPTLKRVTARTISQELVSVQPMEMPSGFTHFVNFNSSGDKPNRNGRIYSGDTPNSNDHIYPMAIRFLSALQNGI